MRSRTTSTTVTFDRPFFVAALDETLPPGTYTVETDEELLEGLTFMAYRRVATMLHVAPASNRSGRLLLVSVDPSELEAAQRRDQSIGADPPCLDGRVDGHAATRHPR